MSEFALATPLSSEDPKTIHDLLQMVTSYYPDAPKERIVKAYEFSKLAHQGQMRKSGEPYIFHPLAVAGILAQLKMDIDTICTALLHDTIEDTLVTIDQIRENFGDTVAFLVDGVTKISKLQFKTSTAQQGENIRKMIVAMGKDVRVILVKLADRLHNMRTLNHMPYSKQSRIAQETLEIYAPLASRLGLSNIKVELEDLSFRYYLPDVYYELSQKLQAFEKDQNKFIEKVKIQIAEELKKNGVQQFQIQGRCKHLWSIYKKIQSRGMDLNQIYDILAFRVIVDQVSTCYAVLGIIHALWKPIPGRFKDFIAMPKANGYQSLHTTVVGPNAQRVEIQIRTFQMHQIAESGIAAHWQYKEGGSDPKSAASFNWLRSLLEWQQTVKSSEEFLDSVKTDLFESDIYVFTPKGDVKEFPEGATIIDFAYSIHTDVGHHCSGARVNGRMVRLDYVLQNGDTVEIITHPHQKPSKDWIKIAVTNRAKSKIRSFIREEQRSQALALGKEIIDKEFKKYGVNFTQYIEDQQNQQRWKDLLKNHGLHREEDLYIRVGYGRLEPKTVLEKLAPEILKRDQESSNPLSFQFISRVFDSSRRRKKTSSLVKVDGYEDLLIHFARCCNPLPGDPIVGFITRGRGISVHRADCPKTFQFDSDRRIDVEWNQVDPSQVERTVKVQVISQDSKGLLKLIAECFAANQLNIAGAQIQTTRDHRAICTFTVEAAHATQISKAIHDLQKIKGTIEVKRLIG